MPFDKTKNSRLTVDLRDELYARLDEYTRARDITKSDLVRNYIKKLLGRKRSWVQQGLPPPM